MVGTLAILSNSIGLVDVEKTFFYSSLEAKMARELKSVSILVLPSYAIGIVLSFVPLYDKITVCYVHKFFQPWVEGCWCRLSFVSLYQEFKNHRKQVLPPILLDCSELNSEDSVF